MNRASPYRMALGEFFLGKLPYAFGIACDVFMRFPVLIFDPSREKAVGISISSSKPKIKPEKPSCTRIC